MFTTNARFEIDGNYETLLHQINNIAGVVGDMDEPDGMLKASQAVLNLANALRVIDEVHRGR